MRANEPALSVSESQLQTHSQSYTTDTSLEANYFSDKMKNFAISLFMLEINTRSIWDGKMRLPLPDTSKQHWAEEPNPERQRESYLINTVKKAAGGMLAFLRHWGSGRAANHNGSQREGSPAISPPPPPPTPAHQCSYLLQWDPMLGMR